MNELSPTGFAEFVANQPEGRTINHKCTYAQCAIGDYYTHIYGTKHISSDEEMELVAFAKTLPQQVHLKLNVGIQHANLNTYGGLNLLLREHGMHA